MSDRNGPDPIDLLRSVDPIDPADVPSASLARVSARIQENRMSEDQNPSAASRRRGPFVLAGALGVAGALALAVALGAFGGLPGAGPVAVGPTATPTEDPGGGGGIASCIRFEPEILPTFDVVFDGTVTAVDGDQVTFDVNTAWKGVDGSVTLTAPESNIALTGPTPEFAVGGRYLVTAAGSNINSCGFTLDFDAATAATWAAAFGG